MEYKVRTMNKDDWASVVDIYYQGMQTNIATFNISCPTYEEWDKSHISECRFVAEYDGDVVGWTALSPVSTRECYKGVVEESIYVDSNHWSKGVGALLIQTLLEESEKNGFWTVQSIIIQSNTASLKLHEKCGFRSVGYRERIAKDRFGVWRNTIMMEHRISSDAAGGCDCELAKKGIAN